MNGLTSGFECPDSTVGSAPLLDVVDVRVHFGQSSSPVRAVDGVSFYIRAGETVALVGESGCGKSVTAMALARLNPETQICLNSGKILFEGRDINALEMPEVRKLRGGAMAYVFQEPGGALNPVRRIAWQIEESLRIHQPGIDYAAEVLRLLARVGMADPEQCARSFPCELSGGMQQRAVIAMALAGKPRLLIADEPTTALDVTIQAQIMDLLSSLQRDLGMSILLITHNLGLVARSSQRVYVMYAGRIVESGPVQSVLRSPAHPYTRGLMAAVPRLRGANERLQGIEGSVPDPACLPEGCAFHPRCAFRKELCEQQYPAETLVAEAHAVHCHYWKTLP